MLHWPASAATNISLGQVTEGGCVSSTVTVKLQPAVLPEVSVAVQFTVVGPSAKTEPEGGVQATVAPGQLSDTAGAKATLVLQVMVTLVTMFAGQTMLGGWLSLTVTVKVHVAILPEASVALQVTVVVPFAKAEPEAGVQATTGVPGQSSVAVGAE